MKNTRDLGLFRVGKEGGGGKWLILREGCICKAMAKEEVEQKNNI